MTEIVYFYIELILKGWFKIQPLENILCFFVIHKTVLGGCDLVSANTQADLKIPYHKNNNKK